MSEERERRDGEKSKMREKRWGEENNEEHTSHHPLSLSTSRFFPTQIMRINHYDIIMMMMRKGTVIIRRCSYLGITTENEGLLTIRKETRCWSNTIIMFSPDFQEERIFFIHLHPPFSHLESFFVISFIWFSFSFIWYSSNFTFFSLLSPHLSHSSLPNQWVHLWVYHQNVYLNHDNSSSSFSIFFLPTSFFRSLSLSISFLSLKHTLSLSVKWLDL